MPTHDESQRTAAPAAPPALPPPRDPQNQQAPYHSHPHYAPSAPGYPTQQAWHYPPPPSHMSLAPPSYHAHSSQPAETKSDSKPKHMSTKSPTVIHTAKQKGIKEQLANEPKVDPMKQDFHFYATEKYSEILTECKRKLHSANLPDNVYLSTTLLNSTLIHNWETAPKDTRDDYLKLEEADRKRFMSEDEVASRHCATLTARTRNPKMAGAGDNDAGVVGKARSFGLGEVVPQMVGMLAEGGGDKRKRDE